MHKMPAEQNSAYEESWRTSFIRNTRWTIVKN